MAKGMYVLSTKLWARPLRAIIGRSLWCLRLKPRRHGLPQRLHSEQPRSFSEHARCFRISLCEIFSTPLLPVRAPLGKLTIFSRKLGLTHAEYATVATSIRLQT